MNKSGKDSSNLSANNKKYFNTRISNPHRRPTPTPLNKNSGVRMPREKRRSGLPRQGRVLVVGLAGVSLVLVLCLLVWAFTNKNAYAVYVDGVEEGIIAKNKNITEESMYNLVIAKLQTEAGSAVKAEQTITFKPVHASKKEIATPEYIIGNIYTKFPYQVEASIIAVDGVEMAKLKSDQEAQEVLEQLSAPYIKSPSDKVSFGNLKVTKDFINPEELVAPDVAYAVLNVTKDTPQQVTVAPGDTLWKIASREGVTVDQLLALNDGLKIDSVIYAGQTLSLVKPQPLVTVSVASASINDATEATAPEEAPDLTALPTP